VKIFLAKDVENGSGGSDYSMKARITGAANEQTESAPISSAKTYQIGAKDMKYILLMSGTRAGVDGYHSWSKHDIEAHMAVLQRINKDLTASGEFVATQGLADPRVAKVVRGEKNGLPVTDGVFPESKEFLLAYWIVDVANSERAYAIAGQISVAPGPGRKPTNMPIEVRQFATHELKSQ
jgi:hypothetical protein